MGVKKTLEQVQAELEALAADYAVFKKSVEDRRAENRLGILEEYAKNNSRRIDDMEVRYNGVVEEINVVAEQLTTAVAELEETDKVSGWRKWKDDQRASSRTPKTDS